MIEINLIRIQIRNRIVLSYLLSLLSILLMFYSIFKYKNESISSIFILNAKNIFGFVCVILFIFFTGLTSSTIATSKLRKELNSKYHELLIIPYYLSFFSNAQFENSNKETSLISKSNIIKTGQHFVKRNVVTGNYQNVRFCKSTVYSADYDLNQIGAVTTNIHFTGDMIELDGLNLKIRDLSVIKNKRTYIDNSHSLLNVIEFKGFSISSSNNHKISEEFLNLLESFSYCDTFIISKVNNRINIAIKPSIDIGIDSYFKPIDTSVKDIVEKDSKQIMKLIEMMKTLEK